PEWVRVARIFVWECLYEVDPFGITLRFNQQSRSYVNICLIFGRLDPLPQVTVSEQKGSPDQVDARQSRNEMESLMSDYKKIRFDPSYQRREILLQNKERRRFIDPSTVDYAIDYQFDYQEFDVYFSYIAQLSGYGISFVNEVMIGLI
ncbi:MAG: hypothetical protein EZS28_036931, partial [Streblomastix strix]